MGSRMEKTLTDKEQLLTECYNYFKALRDDGRECVMTKVLREKLQDNLHPLSRMTFLERLATWMHEKNCHHNHIDGCSWEYEGNDWQANTHKHWLEHAKTTPEGRAMIALYNANPHDPILVDAGLQDE